MQSTRANPILREAAKATLTAMHCWPFVARSGSCPRDEVLQRVAFSSAQDIRGGNIKRVRHICLRGRRFVPKARSNFILC